MGGLRGTWEQVVAWTLGGTTCSRLCQACVWMLGQPVVHRSLDGVRLSVLV